MIRKFLASKFILPFWNILGRKSRPKDADMWRFYIFVALVVDIVVRVVT